MNFVELSETIFRQVLTATALASVLAAIIWPLQRVLHQRLGPAWRHALWVLVLVRLLVPVLPQSPWSVFNLPNWVRPGDPAPKVKVTFSDVVPSVRESLPIETAAAGPVVVVDSAAHVTVFQIASLVWLSVTSLFLLRLIIGSCWLRFRLRKTVAPVDPALIHALCEARASAPTVWDPRLIATSCVDSPGLLGCVRPKLLIPERLVVDLSRGELRHIFLHELAHLKRGDLWINLLMSVAHAMHWFNPTAWLLLRRLRLERELACDALVLRLGSFEERLSYGETILKLLGRIAPRSPFPAVVGIVEEKHAAAARLNQIATFSPTRLFSRKVAVGIVAALAFIGLSNAQNQKSGDKFTPVTASVEAPPPDDSPDGPVENPKPTNRGGYDQLRREYDRQKEQVQILQKHLDELREQLNISKIGDSYYQEQGIAQQEQVRNLEKDRLLAEARYRNYQKMAEELHARSRAELRKVIPTVSPDAAMDRYLGDLAKVEQQYAAEINDFTPEHPKILKDAEMLKTINRQIEERIDGVLAGIDLQVTQSKAVIDDYHKQLDAARTKEAKSREAYSPYFEAKRNLDNQQRVLDQLLARLLSEKVDSQVLSQKTQKDIRHTRGQNSVSSEYVNDVSQAAILVQDARILMELGKRDEADAKLKEAVRLDPDNRIARAYLTQEDAAVSGGSEGTGLYTRTYKVNTRVLAENIRVVLGKDVTPSELMAIDIRNLVNRFGATFPIESSDAKSNSPPAQSRTKAFFYNDRNGVLMVRGTLADLDVVEHVVQFLSLTPPQVTIETLFVEIQADALHDQGMVLRALGITNMLETLSDPRSQIETNALTGILQERDFREVLAGLRKATGVEILSIPKITTLSGRQANVSIDPGPSIDLLPSVEDDGKTIRIAADARIRADINRKQEPLKASAKGIVGDGDTLVIWPKQGPDRTIIIFITPTVIDPAGNRVHPPKE